jgi:site-specific recombinase XerD
MNFRLLYHPDSPASRSPYRVVDEQGQEAGLVNEFLDAQHVRGLSPRSLRAYGFDCLHFARWWLPDPPRPFSAIDESTVRDYLRYQTGPRPQAQTTNSLSPLESVALFVPLPSRT